MMSTPPGYEEKFAAIMSHLPATTIVGMGNNVAWYPAGKASQEAARTLRWEREFDHQAITTTARGRAVSC